MANARKGLGRGLDAIFGELPGVDNDGSTGEQLVALDRIELNPFQPRTVFDEDKLHELSESIKAHGLIQPVLLRVVDGVYQLIAGERRVRAAKLAGLSEVPALIRTWTDHEVLEISIIENVQRQDLDPVEEARAYKRLSAEFGQTQEQIAAKVSKSRSYVANSMRLLQLPAPVLGYLETGVLTIGHVRPLLALDKDEAISLADRLVRESATVRDAERWVRQALGGELADSGAYGGQASPGVQAERHPQGGGVEQPMQDGLGALTGQPLPPRETGEVDSESVADGFRVDVGKKKPDVPLPVELKEIQRIIRDAVNTRVEITQGGKGGKIIIDYYTKDDIEHILELFTGIKEIS